MARAFTAKAGKDYPSRGIKKGEQYWYWSFFRGPKRMSKTPPRQSQLIQSATLSGAHAVHEGLEDALKAAATPAEVAEALENALDELESNISEHEDAIDGMQEGFPNGNPTITEFEERRDSLQGWQEALETAKDEVEALDPEGREGDAEAVSAEMLEEAQRLANDAAGEFPL
jgi:DNA repair exonuclease SbcCD ATPase subunit